VLNTTTLDRLTFQMDIFNLANFINRDWGKISSVGFAGGNTPGLNYNSLEAPGSLVGPGAVRPRFVWGGSDQAFNTQNLTSNYKMQFSVRYSF
jgi:hypothetical protein